MLVFRVVEIAQHVKVVVTKPDSLCLIPRTHTKVGRDNRVHKVVL